MSAGTRHTIVINAETFRTCAPPASRAWPAPFRTSTALLRRTARSVRPIPQLCSFTPRTAGLYRLFVDPLAVARLDSGTGKLFVVLPSNPRSGCVTLVLALICLIRQRCKLRAALRSPCFAHTVHLDVQHTPTLAALYGPLTLRRAISLVKLCNSSFNSAYLLSSDHAPWRPVHLTLFRRTCSGLPLRRTRAPALVLTVTSTYIQTSLASPAQSRTLFSDLFTLHMLSRFFCALIPALPRAHPSPHKTHNAHIGAYNRRSRIIGNPTFEGCPMGPVRHLSDTTAVNPCSSLRL